MRQLGQEIVSDRISLILWGPLSLFLVFIYVVVSPLFIKSLVYFNPAVFGFSFPLQDDNILSALSLTIMHPQIHSPTSHFL